jgi:hypothetical protein
MRLAASCSETRRQTKPLQSRETTKFDRHSSRRRPTGAVQSTSRSEGERHEQVGEPLCQLRGKTWSCLPPPLGPALLSQSLQEELPCENGEGACAHAEVVRLARPQGLPAALPGREWKLTNKDQTKARAAPPSAHRMTTSHGGVCHMNSSRNAAHASAKSPASLIPAVHTGR